MENVNEIIEELLVSKNETEDTLKCVPIDQGGTDSRTAAAARRNLRTDPVLLWTNGEPNDFAVAEEGGTITIPLFDADYTIEDEDRYAFYLVVFKAISGIERIYTEIVPRGVWSDVQWIRNIYTPSSDLEFHGRRFKVDSTEASFRNTYVVEPFGSVASTVEGRNSLIPQAIYGLHSSGGKIQQPAEPKDTVSDSLEI